ncbi:hypothetical protein ACPER7_02195 [Acinetobacter dispersus]|uniref:hypothetical protein n=1 Tax=Acinetobacter dispersus TaxID=70348 RepID=UPI003C2D6A07
MNQKIKDIQKEIDRFNRISKNLERYLFGHSFLYALILFFLFNFGVIKDTIFLNWLSDFFSYFIPLINTYSQKYSYYAAANLYSLLVVGLIVFLYRAVITQWSTFNDFLIDFKCSWTGLRSIFIRSLSLLLFGFFLWISFSEVFVSVQYSCSHPNVLNRACLGTETIPSNNSLHHLFLMVANILFFGLFLFSLMSPLKPKET